MLLISKHGFICYLEQNDPEKQLKQQAVALNNLTDLAFFLVHLVVLEYTMRIQTGPDAEAFQGLLWLQATRDISSIPLFTGDRTLIQKGSCNRPLLLEPSLFM